MARVIGKEATIGRCRWARRPAHVLTQSATVRRVVNMTAIAVVEAQVYEEEQGRE